MIKRRKGFSLVEILISLVLLAVALMAIASSFIASTRLMAHTVDKEKATLIASRTLDFIEGHVISEDQGDWGLSLSDLSGGLSFVHDPFDVTWTVTDDGDAKIVDLTVTWEGASPNSTVNMSRRVSPFGHETVND